MAPNLSVDDYITIKRLTKNAPDTLQRGDVIVFENTANDKTEEWVKRLIGLPGDIIQMRQGRLFINGDKMHTEIDYTQKTFRETLPNGKTYKILDEANESILDNTVEFTVPPITFL